MARPFPLFRIKYYKEYPPMGEGYAVEVALNLDDEWVLDTFFSLQHCVMDSLQDERNFIHFSMINKITELHDLGYTFTTLS